MNVTLDASPLGIGYYHSLSKTGVSRVVEQLVMGLGRTNAVSLALAAPTHLPETMRYAESVFTGKAVRFMNRPAECRFAAAENTLLKPFGRRSLPTKLLREFFYRSRRMLRAEQARFDTSQWPVGSIYHATFYPIPPTVAADRRVSTVQSIHDLIPVLHPEWFPDGESTMRELLDSLPPDAHITTVSDATKADLCAYTGIDPARVTTIHLAASPDLFYPVSDAPTIQNVRDAYGLSDAPYLLSLATVEPRKNVEHILECFDQLVQQHSIPAEVKLVLVGAIGWKSDRLKQLVATTASLRSRLVMTGFVPDHQLAALYSGATGFVYPSLYEGFGLPPLEAMQCGLPVITSNVSSLPEVVGDAALMVPPTDADALCHAMLTVVNNPMLRAELSAKSVARAALFSWDKFIDRHVDLYNRIATT